MLVLTSLVLGAVIATVQARPVGPSRQAVRSERAAHRAERAAALREQRAAALRRRQEARAHRPGGPVPGQGRHAHHLPGFEREHAVVTSTCTLITWTFRKFPNLPSNSIIEKVSVAHYAPVFRTVSFDGEGMAMFTRINPPPGRSRVDTHAKWKTNGLKGSFDIRSSKQCPPAPAVTIEKLQQIAGSGKPFTKSPLHGTVGQTVNYEMIVQNAGNVPLVLSNFKDSNCDTNTIAGGQGQAPLLPGAMPSLGGTTTYTCQHVLTSLNTYENNATVTATPTQGTAVPLTVTSNTVIVNGVASEPAFTIEKLQKIAGSSGTFTSSQLSGEVGQTVDYEMIVKNTGNTHLAFSSFSDAHCDAMTIGGGPSSAGLEPNESATYTCSHLLTSADQTAGSYSNAATVTGTPPEGGAITHTSNTVVVTLGAPPPPSLSFFLGYADGAANDHGTGSGLPSPWKSSAGVTFIGCGFGGTDSCPKSDGNDVYDAGAIRIDSPSGGSAVTITAAKVVIGPCTYEPWPGLNVSLQPGNTLILTQTGAHKCTSTAQEQTNFDTSESFMKSPQFQQFLKTGKCSNDGYIPSISLTIDGSPVTLTDSQQVLNGGGFDPDTCIGSSEFKNWTAVALPSAQRVALADHLAAALCRRQRGHSHRRHGRARTASARCARSTRARASDTVPVTLL
jgi:hypothetical protein